MTFSVKPLFLTLLAFSFSLIGSPKDYVYDSPHGTHQHVLEKLIEMTEGPVIEFGSGYTSTPLLHNLCKKLNRRLITLDDNEQWLSIFKEKYRGDGYEEDNSGWHQMYFVPGKTDHLSPDHWNQFFDSSEGLMLHKYGVCFIDQSPWLARYLTVEKFKHQSDYIIVHDCNYFPEKGVFGRVIVPLDRDNHTEGVFDFTETFTHFEVYYPSHPWPGNTGPPTLVGSMKYSNFPSFGTEKNGLMSRKN